MELPKLKPLAMSGGVFNIVNPAKFKIAIELLAESLFDKGATMFCADNLITWNRNLSFLRDQFFIDKLNDPKLTSTEKSVVWRTYILLYFAKIAIHVDGDFVEFGCHTGHTASEVVAKVDFVKSCKQYYLYDLFEWKDGDEHTQLEGHKNPRMYEDVVKKFAQYLFVHVIRGSVPESLEQGFPEKIAFAHIDMNHPKPEAGVLEQVLPRLSSGGVIIFDDYGWWGYSAQKIAIDPIVAKHNLDILELPTGQGLSIALT